jgi:type I restriction enzyme S subunit
MREGWDVKTLGEIGKVSMCKRILKKQTSPIGDIPFYKIGTFGKIPNAFISKEVHKEYLSKYSFPKKGDILLSASGTIGRRVIYDGKPAYFQDSNIVWIANNEEQVLNEYLYKFYGFCDWNPSRGATISRLYNDDLRRIRVSFPPIQEQRQIVALLDKAFTAIDQAKSNIEKNIVNAKELFQSKLNAIFSQKGDGWEEKQIKDITLLVTKGSSPKWQGINYVEEGGIFFLTSKNVGEGSLVLNNKKYLEEKFNEIQKKSILKKGDVLTNIVGASIGRTAVFDLEEITNINQAVCLMRCDSEKVYSYYLMYLLNSPFFKKTLHDNEVDNARANLSLTFFKNLYIPLPKIIQQKEIVESIKLLSEDIKKIESNYIKKLADLEELKNSILQKAFAGELTQKEAVV